MNNSSNAVLRFVLFVCGYVLLMYGYFRIPVDLFVNVIYYYGMVLIAAELINWMAPLEQVLAYQNHLLSAKADLEIVRGCDCAGALFLIISAIGVFPAKLKWKMVGLALAMVLIHGVNLVRICLLYFALAYRPDWFQLLHIYLAPTFTILAGCLYFAWWIYISRREGHESA